MERAGFQNERLNWKLRDFKMIMWIAQVAALSRSEEF